MLMEPAAVWGILVMAWILVCSVPYLWVTFRYMRGDNRADFTPYGLAWLPGFLVVLALSNSGIPPGIGVIWTIVYLLGLVAFLALRRRHQLIAFTGPLYRDRRFRTFIAGSLLWIAVVQSWDYVAEWSYHYDDGQFTVINLGPPTLALIGWLALRWVRSAS